MSKYTADLETFSEADLKKDGLDNYVNHPSTEITCLSFSDSPLKEPEVCIPGQPFPEVLLHAILDGELALAHNAPFERAMWRAVGVPKYGFPGMPDGQWECTAAQAAHANLPRALDKVGPALGVSEQKDKEGHKIMLKTCKLVRGKRNTDPEVLEKVYSYCQQDVRAEIAIETKMPALPKKEKQLELITSRINRRGMPVDTEMAKGACEIVDIALFQANEQLLKLTDGKVEKPTQVARIKDHLETIGCRVTDLAAQTVEEMLDDESVQGDARQILQIRQDTAGAAVKKYKAIMAQAGADGRCRYTYQHYGAGTGRWAGRGIQFQNLKRAPKDFELTDELRELIVTGDFDAIAKIGNPFTVLGNSLRSVVWPGPGRLFVESDLAGIENRMTHYLADDYDTLEVFRNNGDLYLDLAADIYQIPREHMTKDSHPDERQVGKIVVLGSGFCLGPNGLGRHLKQYTGIEFPLEDVENMVSAYREKFAPVTVLWRELGKGAVACVRTGRPIIGNYWKFAMEGDWLTMQLPSGRKLYYYKPELEMGQWGLEIVYESARGRRALSTPILVENLVQASSRDLLADALIECERQQLFVVGTTHDSIYLECNENDDVSHRILTDIMKVVPDWAEGMPIDTETHVTERMA